MNGLDKWLQWIVDDPTIVRGFVNQDGWWRPADVDWPEYVAISDCQKTFIQLLGYETNIKVLLTEAGLTEVGKGKVTRIGKGRKVRLTAWPSRERIQQYLGKRRIAA